MATNKCIICGEKFKSIRSSKLTCTKLCEKIRKSDYDHNRYLEFRNANRKRRREMLVEKYSICSNNFYKLISVCDDCLTKFYHDYSIYQKFNDAWVSQYNSTKWGSAICPNCGLVEKSECDDEIKQFPSMTTVEKKLFFTELRKCKLPPIKHQAIHIYKYIDFVAEAEDVRKKVMQINPKKIQLTQDEINMCISHLFRSLK